MLKGLAEESISREQALTAVDQILSSEGSVSAVVIMRNDGFMLADGRRSNILEADGQFPEALELMSFPPFGVHVFFKGLTSCSPRTLYRKTSKVLHAVSRPTE